MRFSFLLLFIFFAGCATEHTYRQNVPVLISPKEYPEIFAQKLGLSQTKTYYAIKKGDSLWKISRSFNVTLTEIMSLNGITSAQQLHVGQKILIPQSYSQESTDETNIFAWPLKGNVVTSYGETLNNVINKGINIQARGTHAVVTAAAQGKVVSSGELKGWGKTVILRHRNYFYTIYANLSEITVRPGQTVKQGDQIAFIQKQAQTTLNTKNAETLHFEIRKNHIPRDPMKYLN